jgi:HAD superfamily hydrolase (TIGR01509 family)
MLELFDVVFCSGEEGVVKPERSAFETTLERLGVKAQQAVFIDDSEEHVQAARHLGLQGILFTSAEALQHELAAAGIRIP